MGFAQSAIWPDFRVFEVRSWLDAGWRAHLVSQFLFCMMFGLRNKGNENPEGS
jgi:hypothetical protein